MRQRRERGVADPIEDENLEGRAGRVLPRRRVYGRGERDGARGKNREQRNEADRADHHLTILIEESTQTNGSPYVLRRTLLEKLLETWRALERGEPGRPFEALLTAAPHDPPPARSGHRRRSADEAAQQEVSGSPPSSLRVHGTIVPCAC